MYKGKYHFSVIKLNKKIHSSLISAADYLTEWLNNKLVL